MEQITVESATALRPVGNMLVVRRDDAETMFGQIHLPAQDVQPPDTGTVIAIGPLVNFQSPRAVDVSSDMEPIVGRRVAFTKHGGTNWDKQHMILRQEDIMCFIEDE